MNNMMCSRCKKRVAVVYMTRLDGDKTINEGLCLQCARELGIKPINDLVDKMGLTDEDMAQMDDQLLEMINPEGDDNFEMGGAQPFPFLQNLFSGQQPSAQGESSEEAPRHKERRREIKKPQKEEKKRKYLDQYTENLTRKAADGKIDEIIGRDNEIARVIQILNRRTKNNPCLIGEPGVGKTAIAEGIAQRIVRGQVPPKMLDKELHLLDLTGLIAGTQFRGQFESRIKGLVEEVSAAGNIILFIDEVHNLVGAGDAEGSMNAANILKPALSRGEIQVIGATTFEEYRKYIEKDAALERRFQPVTVNEPTIEDTIRVLTGVKGYYERFHHVAVSEEIVRRAVLMSERYINDRFLPDKAIDLLDEGCSCAALRNKELAEFDTLNLTYHKKKEEEQQIEQPEDGNVDYEHLARVRAELMRIDSRMHELEPAALNAQVTLDDLASVIEKWTGIPASKIEESELEKVARLEPVLKKRIIGQDEAVELVAAAVRRSRVQISVKRRPASFIFVGPTGVGKTELVKVLSQELFDTTDPLIRLDMSEFMEKHSVSRIIGSPPGYVGYDEAGQLTEKVRRKPYSVVLFDEIEKAHPDVMNILLQILDEGRITDAHGRTVSFENTVIVMTSNAGSERREGSLGFEKRPGDVARDKAYKALSEFLRPEFLGRIDEIVVFRPLDRGDYQKIAALMLGELVEPMQEKGIRFAWDDSALLWIADKAYGQKSGARDLRRVIRKSVEDRICSLLVNCLDNPPVGILATAADDALALRVIDSDGNSFDADCLVGVSKVEE